jgi:phenylphosphate carboxylase alpha subunit
VPFDDLRDYLNALSASGDLLEIADEVDWDLEVGAISRLALERDRRSVWFRRIADYPGHSIFAHYCPDLRSAAVALGMAPETPLLELRRVYAERSATPIPPVDVASGPCQTHVKRGDDVDLTDIPSPMLHDGDGGRYLGTWDLVVTSDPQTGVANWNVTRFMLNDRRTLTGNIGRGGGTILRQHYLPIGEAMPVAIVLGADPVSHAAAAQSMPIGVAESGLAGALRGAGVPVVKALTSDLRVPAHAQMVIEGVVVPDRVGREGPYGEYTAYRAPDGDRGLLVRVDAVTFRDDPIHTADCTGFRAGMAAFGELAIADGMSRALRARGVRVVDLNVPNDLARNVVYLSVEAGGAEVCETILDVFAERFRVVTSKIFVFDPDVDVNDGRAVMHAFAMRFHPGRGIHSRSYVGGVKPLLPYLTEEDRHTQSGATVVFDCSWPPSWDRMQQVPARNFFEDVYPEDLRKRVEARFARVDRRESGR